jgi:Spy/CpxP family protein refolding chaperone
VNHWKPIFAAVVIFAAGIVTGSLTLDLRRPPPVADPAWTQPSATPNSPQERWQSRPRDGSTREGPPREGPPREGPGQGRERHLEELCNRMERDLGLNPEQRDQIESIIRETHERVRALVDGIKPETQAEFARMEEQIKTALTPEQIAKFDELAQQRRDRMFRR